MSVRTLKYGIYGGLVVAQALWAATRDSGLQRSVDEGATWQRVFLDTLDTNPASGVNKVFAVTVPELETFAEIEFDGGPHWMTLHPSGEPLYVSLETASSVRMQPTVALP